MTDERHLRWGDCPGHGPGWSNGPGRGAMRQGVCVWGGGTAREYGLTEVWGVMGLGVGRRFRGENRRTH